MLHVLCSVLLTIYLFSYQERSHDLQPKYKLCKSLDSCVVYVPHQLTNHNVTVLCQSHNVELCTGDAQCCTDCVNSNSVSTNTTAISIHIYNKHTFILKVCIVVGCVYFMLYITVVFLKTTKYKKQHHKKIKAVITGAILLTTVLLIASSAISTAIYLYLNIETIQKCQPIFVGYVTWTYTTAMACLDFCIQLLISKRKKARDTIKSSETKAISVFNILSFFKTSMVALFTKLNKICLLWYVLVIAYLECVKLHILYPFG